MRLLKIGRDMSCDIVLHSDKVSSLHAELTLLNSGDIMLEDKGSRNGTFVMNQPIKPNQPVNIRRGDAVRFADVELQWSQVPMSEDNSAYKAIFGIGSHFNNDIQLAGATVSRYHATVKQGRDGKMYLIDHSKNGTTVDSTKIPSNTPIRIKRKSAVVCGGVPVDLSRLPWPNDSWKYLVGIAAGIVVLIGIGLGVYQLIHRERIWDTEAINRRYSPTVVMLIGMFHYELAFDGLSDDETTAMAQAIGLSTPQIALNGNSVVDFAKLSSDEKMALCAYEGTGFFISDDAKIITNLHVIKPWLFDSFSDKIKQMEDLIRTLLSSAYFEGATINGKKVSAFISQVKVKGVSDGVLLIPQGRFFSSENAIKCTVLSAGEDTNKDVALIQSDRMELPNRQCSYVNVTDSLDESEESLRVGKAMFTIGFPHGVGLQDLESEKGLQVYCHSGKITRESSDFSFYFDAVSAGGASGSPIFNDHGKLIGVLNLGVTKENLNEGIKAKYIKEIIESPHVK